MNNGAYIIARGQLLEIGQTYKEISRAIENIGLLDEMDIEDHYVSQLMVSKKLTVTVIEHKVCSIAIDERLIDKIGINLYGKAVEYSYSDIKRYLISELNHEYSELSALEGKADTSGDLDILNSVECIHNIGEKYELVAENYTKYGTSSTYRNIIIQKRGMFESLSIQYIESLLCNR